MSSQNPVASKYPAELQRANHLARAGESKQALEVLETALTHADSFDPAHALQLRILLSLGKRKKALAVLNKTLQLKTDNADAIDAAAFFSRELKILGVYKAHPYRIEHS